MNKGYVIAVGCLVVGLYSYSKGVKDFQIPGIIQTWLPIALAAYAFLGKKAA
jgi:hypothetical protein